MNRIDGLPSCTDIAIRDRHRLRSEDAGRIISHREGDMLVPVCFRVATPTYRRCVKDQSPIYKQCFCKDHCVLVRFFQCVASRVQTALAMLHFGGISRFVVTVGTRQITQLGRDRTGSVAHVPVIIDKRYGAFAHTWSSCFFSRSSKNGR